MKCEDLKPEMWISEEWDKIKTNLVNITRKDGAIDLYFLEEKVAQPPGGVYLGGVLLAMCCWPLRTPTPL